ncbi:MAG: hypothetical protein LBE20_05190 [Deltaproteobacteria bacterium]|jgi:tRNA nucleotidyltransferase (CCA-adding enzyme)|nr:hypothetical protein [Deltaproteobacteria bacterium]
MHPATEEFLRQIGLAAQKGGYLCYVVGGFVRDDLLGIESLDLDLAVNYLADSEQTQFAGLEFAEYLYNFGEEIFKLKFITPKKLAKFKKYRTAKIFFKNSKNLEHSEEIQTHSEDLADFTLDFVTCRQEVYLASGAAPQISSGTLRDDLLRRDFSVNALALNLMPQNFGEVLDYCEGIKDLEQRELNILHAQSFKDDPVRLLRGLRYLQRLSKFGFHFGAKTQALFEQAVREELILNVPPTRLKEEYLKVKKESCAAEILSQMQSIGLLQSCLLNLKIA